MVNNSVPSDARRHGIYFTPSRLAEFLIEPLLTKDSLSVFDPAYGEGALLLATGGIVSRNNSTTRVTLYGCDRRPTNGLLTHLPSSQLAKMDFFNYTTRKKFDVIVMNPPFVRHHLIKSDTRKRYQKTIATLCRIKPTSDLWAYFLVKSCLHLKEGGSIGAILPWSFLQAEYAQSLRIWLFNSFERIRVLALNAEYFNGAQERVILLWLNNYGRASTSIEISFSNHITDTVKYSRLTAGQWQSKSILHSNTWDIQAILDTYIGDYGFKRFEEFGNVRIGVVTGADDFFILNEEEIKELGISEEHLVPMIVSSKDFAGLCANSKPPCKSLVALSSQDSEKFKSYITRGVELKLHLRAHSLRRDPWYSVPLGITPDAFFPYRAKIIPYMVINKQQIQCTNSIHRIYFKVKLSACERKWLQLSLLSIPGQLSIEAYSKTYGSGVLKIEPNALKQSIVSISGDKSIYSVYDKISKCLSLGKKVDAMFKATEFINQSLRIPKELSTMAYSALDELQQRRLSR